MSYDDRQYTQGPGSDAGQAMSRFSGSPGKRPRTMSLPQQARGAAPPQEAQKDPVQHKAETAAAQPQRKELSADAEQWTNVAMRPDLYDEPAQPMSAEDEENDPAPGRPPADSDNSAVPQEAQANGELPGNASEHQGNEAEKDEPGKKNELIEQELAEAGGEPGVTVARTEGEPAVLMTSEEPPPPGQEAPAPEPPAAEAAPQDAAQPGDAATPAQEGTGAATDGAKSLADTAVQQVAAAPAAPDGAQDTEAAPSPAGQKPAPIPATPMPAVAARASGEAREPPPLEEFLRIFESGRSADQDRAEAQGLAAALQAGAGQHKAAILADAAAQKARVTAAAESRVAQIQGAVDAQTAQAQAHYAQTRAELDAQVAQGTAQVRAQIASETAQVQAQTAAQVAAAGQELDARQAEFAAFMAEQQKQPDAIAQAEITRAQGELDAAAGEAVGVGEAEAGRRSSQEAQAAARQVARESAADIRGKKADIAADLRARALEFSAKYPDYGDRVREQIAAVKGGLLPAMEQAAGATAAELESGGEAAIAGMEQKARVEHEQLQAAESQTIARLTSAGNAAMTQVRAGADEATGCIDTAADTMVTQIEQTVAGTVETIAADEEPYLPGVAELVDGTEAQLAEFAATGCSGLHDLADAADASMGAVVEDVTTKLTGITEAAQQSATAAAEATRTALAELSQTRADAAQEAMAALETRHGEMRAGALAELEPALEAIRSEVLGLTEQFRGEIGPATDQSLVEAKKPLTDPLPDRVCEAADQAEESWFSGLLRAVGDIAMGLVIVVLLALAVAAFVAMFGVILGAWTAMMIAGGILLLVGLGMALHHRFTQEALADAPWWKKVGLAVFDTVGGTGITQAVTGRDIVTGQELSAGEQVHGGVTGAFTVVMLFVGGRALVKGPGAAGYTRPTGLPRGWVGWRNALPAAARGVRSVGVELYTGMQMGVRNVAEWFRQRFAGKGEAGKVEIGKGEVGEVETGKGEAGKVETGKVEVPKAGLSEFTNKTATELLDASQGRSGNGSSVGHAGDHIPPEGATKAEAMAHSTLRSNKANTTVYRSHRHAIQDLKAALNSKLAELDAMVPGQRGLFFRYALEGPRQGFNSQRGAPPTEVSFRNVSIYIEKLADGTLHLDHFTPRLDGL